MKFYLKRIKSPVAVILAALVLGGCAATHPSDPLADSIRTTDPDAVVDTDKALAASLIYGLSGNNTAARQVARIDLDEPAVRRNMAYYRTLRALNDPKAILNAVGGGGIAPKGFTGKLSIGG